MDTLTLKVPEFLKEQLNTFAKKKGLNRSEIIRDALAEYFSKNDSYRQGSFYDLSKDIAGSINAPSDLSINKRHLDGYGR
jgi:metal-responsive CopG/Arc/MetJ family transcriptional regulator